MVGKVPLEKHQITLADDREVGLTLLNTLQNLDASMDKWRIHPVMLQSGYRWAESVESNFLNHQTTSAGTASATTGPC